MRAMVRDTRPVPVGVNLAPPLSMWTLAGGAVYLPDEDAVLLPTQGASVTSPWIRTDHPRILRASEEWFTPDSSKARYVAMHYADATQAQIGANANATTTPAPGSWQAATYSQGHSAVNRMSESVWGRVTYSILANYGVPGSKVRAPQFMVITR